MKNQFNYHDYVRGLVDIWLDTSRRRFYTYIFIITKVITLHLFQISLNRISKQLHAIHYRFLFPFPGFAALALDAALL